MSSFIQSKEQRPQSRLGLITPKSPGLDADLQADVLLEHAQETQADQTALFEAIRVMKRRLVAG